MKYHFVTSHGIFGIFNCFPLATGKLSHNMTRASVSVECLWWQAECPLIKNNSQITKYSRIHFS